MKSVQKKKGRVQGWLLGQANLLFFIPACRHLQQRLQSWASAMSSNSPSESCTWDDDDESRRIDDSGSGYVYRIRLLLSCGRREARGPSLRGPQSHVFACGVLRRKEDVRDPRHRPGDQIGGRLGNDREEELGRLMARYRRHGRILAPETGLFRKRMRRDLTVRMEHRCL